MNEQFLHYIWKFQYFDKTNLQTQDGKKLQVIVAGTHNHDAGADFEDAIVEIEGIKWQGTIEIDTYGFNWESHQHATNEAYENVILHVVWKNPREVISKNGSKIPVLVVENRIDERLWLRYQEFLRNEHKVPCQGYWSEKNLISSFEKMMQRTLDERLIRKSQHVLSLLERNSFDWEETSYQILLEHFGFKKNNAPFLQLAKELPFKIIKKHANQIFQVEALFYGMAGFLSMENGQWIINNLKNAENKRESNEKSKEELEQKIEEEVGYFEALQREFRFLSHKYSLQEKEVNLAQWKFLRLRPSNFPTVRIAQVVGLLSQQNHLFSIILNAKNLKEFYSFFKTEIPSYWKTHYHFGKTNAEDKEGAIKENKTLGKDAQQNLIINVVVPIRVAYSLYKQQQDDFPKKWLSELSAEKNSIIKLYKPLEKTENADFKIKTAAQSQALLELYSQYCNVKKCLSCEVGKDILRK
ncbi:DUF2851 family protein [Bernardetia sp.]|uniref:DUF2851 family protein n=1 Tax=Bernardetia sp. TaxID=1937974 RepID=UPI0025B967A7|nr:DUF2851 family protein [Bernardetia sp.]